MALTSAVLSLAFTQYRTSILLECGTGIGVLRALRSAPSEAGADGHRIGATEAHAMLWQSPMTWPRAVLHECSGGKMAFDLVIDIENTPGALARVATAISDAGVNIAAATCIGNGERAEVHILVPHAEAAKHALAISHLAVTREREVVVVDVEDRPGVLADLTRKIARAGVDLDLVYVATRNRVVFGSRDLAALRRAVDD